MANMGENSRHANALYVPKPIAEILVEVSRIPDMSMKLSKLEFYLLSIEEELGKIEGLKNELPLCMELLKEGIDTLKKELGQCKEKEAAKDRFMEGKGKSPLDVNNKRNWMSTALLWTTPVHYEKASMDDVFLRQETLLSLKSKFDHNNGETSGVQIPVVKAEESLDLNVKVEEAAGFQSRAVNPVVAQPKPRRCWSPELHRRFVDALHLLGGPNYMFNF